MSFLAKPMQFTTAAEFESYVSELEWNKGWTPRFITGHNTGNPNLALYTGKTPHGYTDAVRRKWPANLNNYYRNFMHWHSGPHMVICPKIEGGYIWVLCDLEQDGVSVSCWNRLTIGIEMVGDYSVEDPTTGHGAEVRDQFVEVAAILCKHFSWRPRPQVLGRSGVHWHRQCSADHHDCPGKHWDSDDVLERIEKAMAVPSAVAASSTTKAVNMQQSPISSAAVQSVAHPLPVLQRGQRGKTVAKLQATLNDVLTPVPPLVVDGDFGTKTENVLKNFQAMHGIKTSIGIVGPETWALLPKTLVDFASGKTGNA